MQQQAIQQEQYGHISQPQMPQQIMMCPIQYVYDSPMLMGQPQDDQIQQNQNVLFSVQNPPPWIQTQPQNQIVYIQQIVPSNYQTYQQQNVIQNPIYQPQINYQIQQPIMAQDNRQFIQLSNVTSYNTVQSQPTQMVAQVNKEAAADRMPVLTQMLNQKPNVVNNVGAQANFRPAPPVNVIRPVTQNQQVQTEISANNKGRPRNSQPQVITINPMQQRQYVQQKPDVVINIARPQSYIRPEVPQHIKSKIPSSISVKTIYKPIHPRPTRPYDAVPVQQHFYYSPNFITAPNNTDIRNNIISNMKPIENVNSEEPNNGKRKLVDANATTQTEIKNNMVNNLNNVQGNLDLAEPNSNTNMDTRNSMISNVIQSNKVQGNIGLLSSNNATIKFLDASVSTDIKNDPVKMCEVNNDKINTAVNLESEAEKLIRNTVYVQARGRVMNEKEIQVKNRLKRTIDGRVKKESKAHNANSCDDIISGKIKKFTDSSSQTKSFMDTSLRKNGNAQLNNSTNSLMQGDNMKNTSITPQLHKTVGTINVFNHTPDEPKPIKVVTTEFEQIAAITANNISLIKENHTMNKPINTEIKENHDKVAVSLNNNDFKEESNVKDNEKTNENQIVLTHVLDGYIIQESNIAFPIHTPTTESENSQDTINVPNENIRNDSNNTGDANEDNHKDSEQSSDNQNLSTEIETITNKDDPFESIKKTTVASWTTEQLIAHLEKYEWRETAAKLQDEEIDGESLLLVNKEQLVTIGICDQHASAIAAFAETR